ncbi:MAG: universal stress protein [Candidatus Sericytochromatia bacterium]
MLINKILLSVKSEDDGEKIFNYAKELALSNNVEIVILHCYYIPKKFEDETNPHYHYIKVSEDKMIEHGNKILNDIKEKAENAGLNCKTILKKGIPCDTIISEAEDNNCDLIIMGIREHGFSDKKLISSTSNYVIHHTTCPVMLVH